MPRNSLFTSESVTEGHPDKICDGISDAILDAALAQDKHSRVACETLVKTGMVVVAGEITTTAVRQLRRHRPREDPEDRLRRLRAWASTATPARSSLPSTGSRRTFRRASRAGKGLFKEQGAGDQGMMFGYACDETRELMPMPIMLAHRLTRRLSRARRNGELPFLRPDGKSQVSVVYEEGRPVRVDTVVVSSQHSAEVSHRKLREGDHRGGDPEGDCRRR